MNAVKQIVFTLCIASFSVGVLLHLFPDAAARRCMKAVAGLYLLSAVLNGGQQVSVFLPGVQNVRSNTTEACSQQVGDSVINATGFTEVLLSETKSRLDAQYTAYLIAQGYDASIDISLAQTQEGLVVQDVCIVSQNSFSEESKQTLSSYFKQELCVTKIIFDTQEENIQ